MVQLRTAIPIRKERAGGEREYATVFLHQNQSNMMLKITEVVDYCSTGKITKELTDKVQ